MELHISTDDIPYITDIYEYAVDNADSVDGYLNVSGLGLDGAEHNLVKLERSNLCEKHPKTLSFGEMLNAMMHEGNSDIYFKRDDWGDNHFLALNRDVMGELYLEEFYKDNRYAQGYERTYRKGEIPVDSHPYIPSYDDYFSHKWSVGVVLGEVLFDGEDDEEEF